MNCIEAGCCRIYSTNDKIVDCIVENLPWGQNTIAYSDENVRIMEHLASTLRQGTPCASVTSQGCGFTSLYEVESSQDTELIVHDQLNADIRRLYELKVSFADSAKQYFHLPL